MIGFTLEHLGDDGQNSCHSKTIARDFCLQIINEVYDIDYNRYWHADLDSLLLPDEKNWFSSRNEGAFYLLRALGDNKPVAAGGLYNLRFKPSTRERLLPKYRADMNICQIVRVYLSAPYRGNGLGRQLVKLLEADAMELGYQSCYLHADAQAKDTLRFWKSVGYEEFGRFSYSSGMRIDTSVDFDKTIIRRDRM